MGAFLSFMWHWASKVSKVQEAHDFYLKKLWKWMCLCLFVLHFTLKPRGLALLASCRPISTPQKPEQCRHGPAVCLTLSYWIQTLRLGGREVRMGFDSFWRVHLLNLWTFWMMFRLGRRSKHWTLVLDDPLAGWDLYYWNTERSEAKLCILSGPQCWLANSFNGESLNKHGKGLKCARTQKLSQIAVAECVFNVAGDDVRQSSLCDLCNCAVSSP